MRAISCSGCFASRRICCNFRQGGPIQLEVDLARGFFPTRNSPIQVRQFAPPTVSVVAVAIQKISHQASASPHLFDADASFNFSHCHGKNKGTPARHPNQYQSRNPVNGWVPLQKNQLPDGLPVKVCEAQASIQHCFNSSIFIKITR